VLFGRPSNRSLTHTILIWACSLPATPLIPASKQRQSLRSVRRPWTIESGPRRTSRSKNVLFFLYCFGLRSNSLRRCSSAATTTPSPIQKAAIPELMLGRDSGGPGPDRNRQDSRLALPTALPGWIPNQRTPQVLVLTPPGTRPAVGRSLSTPTQPTAPGANSADLRGADFR